MSPLASAIPAFLPALPLASRAPLVRRAASRRRPPTRASPRVPLATLIRPGSSPTDADLAAFSAAVKGEWTGYEGTFDNTTAQVQAVPDYYIPEQFSEWNLIPMGFETNHSTIVREHTLYRKFFRILPTVSHFADHVDMEEDLDKLPLSGEHATAIFADGSFIAGMAKVLPERTSRLDKWPALSFSLRDPHADARRAVNLWVKFDFANRKFAAPVRVVLERWSCAYCDGADLDGSSGFVDGWTCGKAGHVAMLKGEWYVCSDPARDFTVQNPDDAVILRGDEEDARAALYLPEGIDVAVLDAPNGDGVIVRAGWLVDENTRVVLRRIYAPDGSVEGSEHFVERRML